MKKNFLFWLFLFQEFSQSLIHPLRKNDFPHDPMACTNQGRSDWDRCFWRLLIKFTTIHWVTRASAAVARMYVPAEATITVWLGFVCVAVHGDAAVWFVRCHGFARLLWCSQIGNLDTSQQLCPEGRVSNHGTYASRKREVSIRGLLFPEKCVLGEHLLQWNAVQGREKCLGSPLLFFGKLPSMPWNWFTGWLFDLPWTWIVIK